MSTKLQSDLKLISDKFAPGAWERRTLHNARIKLKCLEELLGMHDAMGDALELAHEIDEEQDELNKD